MNNLGRRSLLGRRKTTRFPTGGVRYLPGVGFNDMTFVRAGEAGYNPGAVNPLKGSSWVWKPTDTPRLLTYQGLQCIYYESSHENTVAAGEDFTGSLVISTPNSQTAPDGEVDADHIEGNGGGSDYVTTASGSTTQGGIASIWVKGEGGNDKAYMRIGGGAAARQTGSNFNVTPSWERFVDLEDGGATPSSMLVIPGHVPPATDDITVEADGQAASFWGGNYDPARTFLTAYIRTAAVQPDEDVTWLNAGLPATIKSGRWGFSMWPGHSDTEYNNAVGYASSSANYIGIIGGQARIRSNSVSYQTSVGSWSAFDRFDFRIDFENVGTLGAVQWRKNGGTWTNISATPVADDWTVASPTSDLTMADTLAFGDTWALISLPYEVEPWL